MIVAIEGESKTGKTSLSLTFQKPLHHLDLDPGGFERAARRFQAEVSSGSIKHTTYFTPLQAIKEKIGGAEKAGMVFLPTKRLKGYKELWYKLLGDYFTCLESKTIRVVVFDPFTAVWELCRHGYLQELQERQDPNEKPRERLQPIEHGIPNTRMKSLLDAGREAGKDLVLVHSMTDVYEKRLVDGRVEEIVTGRDFAGWKYLESLVDLLLLTRISTQTERVDNKTIVKHIPEAEVKLSGLGLDLLGVKFIDPSYDKIVKHMELAGGR